MCRSQDGKGDLAEWPTLGLSQVAVARAMESLKHVSDKKAQHCETHRKITGVRSRKITMSLHN